MAKAFDSPRLVGRMPADASQPDHSASDCEIDLVRREMRVQGSPVPLGARAFEIIEVLAESAGELVTKDELTERVWPGAVVNDNALHAHISAIRKALGSHRAMLKTEAGRGYRLLGTWDILRQPSPGSSVIIFPRMPEATNSAGNLPIIVDGLIGRSEAELLLRKLVSAHRVLTLTGPGGIGKTSLAVRLAYAVLGEFRDGGWLVEFAPLSDPNRVAWAVGSVLGLDLGYGERPTTALAQAIGDKNYLLVLDNCEHLIDATADLAEKLVRFCPRTTVLVTSREVLRIEGECVYRVPPLGVPSETEAEPGNILGYGAVELFLARLQASNSSFIPNAGDLPFIAAICRRLDGIPLAIEFAAARAAALGVQAVVDGLADRFALLTAGRRTALRRHQTLRATLDWSYDLLSETEQSLLRHLSVFPSRFSVASAIAVVGTAIFDASAAAVGIADLVEKSLVTLDKSNAMPCWYLSDTIRAYVLEKLIQQGEFDNASQRQAAYASGLLQE